MSGGETPLCIIDERWRDSSVYYRLAAERLLCVLSMSGGETPLCIIDEQWRDPLCIIDERWRDSSVYYR